MRPFEYSNPKTLPQALALLGAGWDDAAVLAGGTDLLSLMKDDLAAPKRLVSIKAIPALRGITSSPKGLHIGAAVTIDELAENPLVRRSLPALVTAATGITSPQIRNMGTVGGDLCQRPRCWYYRGGFGLLGMKDGHSMVEDGDNRYHAIFGAGPARFVSASSFGPALIALGAKIQIASASGAREVDAEKFFVSPASGDAREIALAPNELVTGVLIPPQDRARNATYEVRQKDALDWPLATASVVVRSNPRNVDSARIVLGHVAPTPWIATEAEAKIKGLGISPATAKAVAEAAVSGASPLSGNAYKVQLARVAVERALMQIFRMPG